MVKGLTKTERWVKTLAEDEELPENDRTKFSLTFLPNDVRAIIMDNAQSMMNTEAGLQVFTRSQMRNLEIVRYSLKGVENYRDAQGNDIQWTGVTRVVGGNAVEVCSDTFLNTLDPAWITQLAEDVLQKSTPSAALRGK